MKRLFKWARWIGVLTAALALLLLLFKDPILRAVVEHRIRARTGLEVEIGRLSVGLFSPVVTVEDLRLYNSPAFGGTPFIVMPELHLELDRAALAEHQLHIRLLRCNVAELDVVRNEAGQTNVVSLFHQVRTRSGGKGGLRRALQGYRFTGIDVLNLTFGKVRYIDLKQSRNNRVVTVDLENQVFRDVKSDADVYGILFMAWLRSGGSLTLAPGGLPTGSLP
jgi:uncharacterized protein involved in outer membrane biogenesis